MTANDDPVQTPRPETSMSARSETRGGIAAIKTEYLIDTTPIVDKASATDLNSTSGHRDSRDTGREAYDDDAAEAGGSSKRRKTDDRDNKGSRGKDRRGQNKGREFGRVEDASGRMCKSFEMTGKCDRGLDKCRFSHDWVEFFKLKPFDMHHEPHGELISSEPYVKFSKSVDIGDAGPGGGWEEDWAGKTIDLSTTCPTYEDIGYCPFGWRCRFLGGHVRRISVEREEEGDNDKLDTSARMGKWELGARADGAEKATGVWKNDERNWIPQSLLQSLRVGSYDFTLSRSYLAQIEPEKKFTLGQRSNNRDGGKDGSDKNGKHVAQQSITPQVTMSEEDAMNEMSTSAPALVGSEEDMMNEQLLQVRGKVELRGVIDGETEAMDLQNRPEEKKRLNWENGLYLAPLTTVGNLPFRRLCAEYGATITCCEMSLADPIVHGATQEWALVRRHKSEKMFGIQLAGGYANRMVPAAEVIKNEIGEGVDFVDINMGCPIDLIFNQGAGSALMDAPNRIGKLIVGMNRVLGDIPLTVKFRTGVANNKPNAHKLIPKFASWGAAAMTLHGRSRTQRYSKLADWEYIKTCATTLRDYLSDEGLAPIPIFGNGDCFSAQSYYEEKERSGVDGVMVARGALIKPWIFTEISERREWDISATERLEGIRKFAEYGLSHWGSDTQGVHKTRRFLCEALSFQHRYIPIGLLERLPPKLNERPPAYRGRNELETLLSSPYVGDWVKIADMFLGKADDGFSFVPKHKSNAYGGEEAQG